MDVDTAHFSMYESCVCLLQVRERLLSCYTRLLEAANILGYFPIHQPHSLLVTGETMNMVPVI